MVQPGAAPDMNMILEQAQKMQQQLMSAQAELAQSEVTGQAGGNLVSITLAGSGEVRSVTIDPKVVDPDDVETLQDLVMGAMADAHRALQDLTQQKMGPLASALGGPDAGLGGGLGLPGM
ncbi:MAG: YbaB/EbfC family nucleoid-associated protein [Pseudonocardiaceae bacterium]